LPSFRHQLEQVAPAEGLTAGEHQDGHLWLPSAQLGKLIDQGLTLGRGKVRHAGGIRFQPAAMGAGEVAADRRFPEEHSQDSH
jgi:hypothetical protein